MRHTKTILCTALLSFTTFTSLPAAADSDYPSKQIRMIIPFPAGGGPDSSARLIARYITQETGQVTIVENKPGASGFIAAQTAAQAAPDGYTVFMTSTTTQALNPSMFKVLPYDPIKDFDAVSRVSLSPMLLVVRNTEDQPNTVAELTENAKRMPGKLAYGSGATSSRVAAENYKQQAGIDLLHVPYKGTVPAIADLLGGQVDVMFPDLTPSVPLVKDGRLRALGVTGSTRISALPDVPTMAEAGLPGFDLVTWSAAYVPTGTPKPIVDRLSQLINEALRSKEAEEFFARTGSAPAPTTPSELAAFTRSELEKWGRAAKIAGIEPE